MYTVTIQDYETHEVLLDENLSFAAVVELLPWVEQYLLIEGFSYFSEDKDYFIFTVEKIWVGE